MSSVDPLRPVAARITPAAQRGLARGQMSLRGRVRAIPVRLAPIRSVPVGADMKERLLAVWPGLMLRKFTSDAQNAAAFGVERQTASYWRNGDTGPNGAAVALAWLLWPEELSALLGAGA